MAALNKVRPTSAEPGTGRPAVLPLSCRSSANSQARSSSILDSAAKRPRLAPNGTPFSIPSMGGPSVSRATSVSLSGIFGPKTHPKPAYAQDLLQQRRETRAPASALQARLAEERRANNKKPVALSSQTAARPVQTRLAQTPLARARLTAQPNFARVAQPRPAQARPAQSLAKPRVAKSVDLPVKTVDEDALWAEASAALSIGSTVSAGSVSSSSFPLPSPASISTSGSQAARNESAPPKFKRVIGGINSRASTLTSDFSSPFSQANCSSTSSTAKPVKDEGPVTWNIQNLTRNLDDCGQEKNGMSLQFASDKRANSKRSLHHGEQRLARLRHESKAAAARAGIVPGQSVASAFVQLEEKRTAAEKTKDKGEAELKKLRTFIGMLDPGPEMLEASANLSNLHAKVHEATEDSKKCARMIEDAKLAMQLESQLQNHREKVVSLRSNFEEADKLLNQTQENATPQKRQLEIANRLRRELPSPIPYVRGTADLPKALGANGTPSISDLSAHLACEWVFWLDALGRPDDAQALPAGLLINSLNGTSGSPSEIPQIDKEVVLAVRANTPTRCDEPRHVVVFPDRIRGLREKLRKPPSLPNALELLRGAIGIGQNVRLHNVVKETVLAALAPRQCDPPGGLKTILRPYQLVGFRWLVANAENGIGGLLADEMGLGKTLQTVTLLAHLHSTGRIGVRPALVVAPFSVLSTWESELKKWAPNLSVVVHHGAQRTFSREDMDGVHVLLTTYATLQRDADKFCLPGSIALACMVLDEAQAIKNPKSLTSKSAKQVAEHNAGNCMRVALTGTPIENKLGELYSIFEFLNPGFLGTQAEFAKTFERVVNKDTKDGENSAGAAAVLKRLSEAVGPLILRRMKTDKAIAPDLPEKLELVHTVALTRAQRRLYAVACEVLLKSVLVDSPPSAQESRDLRAVCGGNQAASVPSSTAKNGVNKNFLRQARVLAALHVLQQTCNHPATMPSKRWPDLPPEELDALGICPTLPEFGPQCENSGKMARLMELLAEILSPPREKVLIFTQYRGALDLVANLVEATFPDTRACRFHGGLTRDERDTEVKRFTEDPACGVMVLTLGAGGVGLTLTAAAHVVHFDRCWNPAKEAQATDRAHRIGQRSTVVVHRIITEDTFEVRLATVVAKKRKLADDTLSAPSVEGTKVIAECNDDELRQLFRLGSGPPDLSSVNKLKRKLVPAEIPDLFIDLEP